MDHSPSRGRAPLALGVKRIIDDELLCQNLVVTETERAETVRNPSQTFTGRMWLGWMRVGGAHNFTKQHERGISQVVFFQDGIERDIFAVMTEFAALDVEWRRSEFARIGLNLFRGHENKFGFRVNELPYEPRARDSVHFDFLACDPFHCVRENASRAILVSA